MAVTPGAPVLALLRAAAMAGARVLEPALAADVELDASRADEPRLLLRGRDAVLDEIERWWGGGAATLIDWDERVEADGAMVELERIEERGRVTRLRLCLRWRDAVVGRIWAWEARPRPEATATPEAMPDAVAALLRPGREVRRVRPGRGWLARLTADPGREALLPWARLPAGVVEVVADEHDGWWVVREARGDAPALDANTLAAVAVGLRTVFADGPPVAAAARLRDRLVLHAPATAQSERGGLDLAPKQLESGWDAFAQVAGPELAGAVLAAAADPDGLAARLQGLGRWSLVHGNLRAGAGWRAGSELVLDDWALATWAPEWLEWAWAEEHRPTAHLAERWRDGIALARLVDRGWRLGLAGVAHPDRAIRVLARAEIEQLAPGARRALS